MSGESVSVSRNAALENKKKSRTAMSVVMARYRIRDGADVEPVPDGADAAADGKTST